MGLQIDRLQALREQRGLSQRELARLCGLSATQIHKYESGQNDPTSNNLVIIAERLHVSSDFLLGMTNDPHGHAGDGTLTDDERVMLQIYRRDGWPGVIRLGAERLTK